MKNLKFNFKPQVPPERFKSSYDSHGRWNSYWVQIEWILWFKPKTVLEVGPGHGLVSWYLRTVKDLDVTTVDIDPRLKPNIVCSVTELSKHFNEANFDVVLAAEVLEHIPFEYLQTALKEINYVTRQGSVITLPHDCRYMRFLIDSWMFRKTQRLITLDRNKPHIFGPRHHYWEIGKKGFDKHKIEEIISKYFKILHSFNIFENPYHRVYILYKSYS